MAFEKSKVLVVDDFDLPRLLLKKALGELGFKRIDEASNGEDALTKLNAACDEKQPYTIMFSDINMPIMTGLELLTACRADPRMKTLPIVMISAEGEVEHITTALQEGANDFVVKPFSPENLIKRVERLSKKMPI